MVKYPDFGSVENALRTSKNLDFLKNAITLRKTSTIDPANHLVYRAFRRSSKKIGVSDRQDLKITVFGQFRRFFGLNATFRPLSRQKWVCPPKKVDSFGAKLAHKNFTLAIYRPEPRGVFRCVNLEAAAWFRPINGQCDIFGG